MNKPYITLKVLIPEIIGIAMTFAALIISIATGSWSILPLPITMLFSVLVVSLVLHLLPASSWNMPVKVKPENALKVYEDAALLLALTNLALGLMTLLMTLNFANETFMIIITIGICVAITAIIFYMIHKIKRDNG